MAAKDLHRTTLRLPRTLWVQVRKRCIEDGVPFQDFAAEALRDRLKKTRKGGRRR